MDLEYNLRQRLPRLRLFDYIDDSWFAENDISVEFSQNIINKMTLKENKNNVLSIRSIELLEIEKNFKNIN